ncbi:hypothetical protein [Pseudovibrio sp. SCP19]|uniref:hypothetical protein n=1 Tax=Pseudovibrio sp. SCP19 TaxID=3141374 RepID=UPI0033385543
MKIFILDGDEFYEHPTILHLSKLAHDVILPPPATGVRPTIINQMAEARTLSNLAKDIQLITGYEIDYLPDPRNEAEENGFVVRNDQLRSFGWKPILMEDRQFLEVTEITQGYRNRADHSKIQCVSYWTKHTQEQQTIKQL